MEWCHQEKSGKYQAISMRTGQKDAHVDAQLIERLSKHNTVWNRMARTLTNDFQNDHWCDNILKRTWKQVKWCPECGIVHQESFWKSFISTLPLLFHVLLCLLNLSNEYTFSRGTCMSGASLSSIFITLKQARSRIFFFCLGWDWGQSGPNCTVTKIQTFLGLWGRGSANAPVHPLATGL